ncbi:hypothetical protein HQ487_02305 [Candidatus Uhrbacteria bacterium]|nr:hypothetical protein [Candidatus Uhrbacteria bacterium]
MNEELTQITRQVLGRGYVMSLGIVDENGPWVADVIYVFDEELNVYWMSKTVRRHSLAIDGQYSRVAVTITVTHSAHQLDEGVQMAGMAMQVENPSEELIKQWMEKKQKMYVSEMGVVLPDHVWYKFIPDKIKLIHEEKFGYERQDVNV